jgi:hypothetical protein
MQGSKTRCQIGIAVKEMFAVSGISTALSFADEQLVCPQQSKQFIATDEDMVLL